MKSRHISYILIVVISVSARVAFSQVSVSGKINEPDSIAKLSVAFPYTSLSNNIQQDTSVKVANGAFSFLLPIKSPCFISIEDDSKPLGWFFVSPGDSLFLEFNLSQLNYDNRYRYLKAGGSNAAGHEFFNGFNFYPAEKYNPIRTLLEKHKNKFPTIGELKVIINNSLSPLDSLWKLREIDSNFHKYVTADLEAALAHEAAKAGRNRKPDSTLRIFRQELYNAFNPFNHLLLNGQYGAGLGLQYVNDIADSLFGIPPSIPPDKQVQPFLNRFWYAPPNFTENYLAEGLAVIIPAVPDGIEGLDKAKALRVFRENFPNSPYLKPLLHIYKESLKNFSPKTEKDAAIRFLQLPPQIKTIQQLHRTYFNNKFLFIDIWATWCVPCLKQFTHSDTLYRFLQDNGIENIYISIDKPIMKSIWQQKVKSFGLNGFHLLATESLLKNISKTLYYNKDAIAIPRYLLISPNGKILNPNLEQPENMEALQQQIRAAKKRF